jgi:type II secretion system protein N
MDREMGQMMGKNKKWVLYALYCIILAVALLYLRFPSDSIKDYLQATTERMNSPFRLSMDDVSPSLTLGLMLSNTQLSDKSDPDKILFRADRLMVRPSALSYIRGKQRFGFDCVAYKGGLKGYVNFTKNGTQSPLTVFLRCENIHVGDMESLRTLIGRQISGALGGTITFTGHQNAFLNGTGEADLRLSNGMVELLQPILSLEAIEFAELWIKLSLKNNRVNLTHFELKGKNMRGNVSGVVSLKKELAESSLDLKGTIEPFADFFKDMTGAFDGMRFFKRRLKGGKLSFTVRGTVAEPRIEFI